MARRGKAWGGTGTRIAGNDRPRRQLGNIWDRDPVEPGGDDGVISRDGGCDLAGDHGGGGTASPRCVTRVRLYAFLLKGDPSCKRLGCRYSAPGKTFTSSSALLRRR